MWRARIDSKGTDISDSDEELDAAIHNTPRRYMKAKTMAKDQLIRLAATAQSESP